jgi:cytochrome c5
MSHNLIRRAAILLALLLVLAAMAFAINTTQRERRLAARATPIVAGAAPAAYDAKAAAASFESRCLKCHEVEEMHDWLTANPGADRQAKLIAFLKKHKKAPEPESETIARYVSELPPAKR